jgi:hypothetical protein
LLGEWHIRWDLPGAGRQFAAVMEARRQGELEKEFKPLRRGWCLGSKQFRADMLKYVEEQRSPCEVRLASKLRSESTVTVGWLAERLQMGTRGHLAHLLS